MLLQSGKCFKRGGGGTCPAGAEITFIAALSHQIPGGISGYLSLTQPQVGGSYRNRVELALFWSS